MSSTPGSRLQAARKRLGLTQQGVADQLSHSVHTYKRWEQDKAKPRTSITTKRLCDFLHISIDHYLHGTDNRVLSPEQKQLLDQFEKASPAIQQAVKLILGEGQ